MMNKKHIRRLTGFFMLSLFFIGIYFLIMQYRDKDLVMNNLAITDYTIHEKIYINEIFDVYATLKNTGNRDIKGPFDIIWVPDTTKNHGLIKTKLGIDTLKAGAEAWIEFSDTIGKLSEGRVISRIRVLSKSKEQNDTDNHKLKEIEIIKRASSETRSYKIQNNGGIELRYEVEGKIFKAAYYDRKGRVLSLPANATNIVEYPMSKSLYKDPAKINKLRIIENTLKDLPARHTPILLSQSNGEPADEARENIEDTATRSTLIPSTLPETENTANKEKATSKDTAVTGTGITDEEIAIGLRQALKLGLEKQVCQLAEEDGFFRNKQVKILLPEILRQRETLLKMMGMGNTLNEVIKLLNRAAERAVNEAMVVLEEAVNKLTFADARAVLMGNDSAATIYLESVTRGNLYAEFYPIVKKSLEETNTTDAWKKMMDKYNELPKHMFPEINPDLIDHVTRKALKGVFTMIAVEEAAIRTNESARTTVVLRKVFILYD